MRRAFIGGSILLLTSMLVAQTAPTSQPSSTSLAISPSASSCPVSLQALQGAGSGLIMVRDAKPAPGASQRIHLILSSGSASRPVSGKVVVRGLSGKNNQAVPTQLSDEERFDQSRMLHVTFTPEGNKDGAADLMLPGFTSVGSIHLESIHYDDGSTRQIASGQVCRVAPDPLMLVAGR